MKFGCCTGAENYEALASCGYDFIELSGHEVFCMEPEQWRELTRRIEAVGVPCVGFNDYCHHRPAIVGDGFDPAAIREYAQCLLDRGAQIQIQNVGIGAPTARRLPPEYPRERAEEQCCRFLEITAIAFKWASTLVKSSPEIPLTSKDTGSVTKTSCSGSSLSEAHEHKISPITANTSTRPQLNSVRLSEVLGSTRTSAPLISRQQSSRPQPHKNQLRCTPARCSQVSCNQASCN